MGKCLNTSETTYVLKLLCWQYMSFCISRTCHHLYYYQPSNTVQLHSVEKILYKQWFFSSSLVVGYFSNKERIALITFIRDQFQLNESSLTHESNAKSCVRKVLDRLYWKPPLYLQQMLQRDMQQMKALACKEVAYYWCLLNVNTIKVDFKFFRIMDDGDEEVKMWLCLTYE